LTPCAVRSTLHTRSTDPDSTANGGPGLARKLPGFRDPAPGGERNAPPPVAPAAAGRRRGRTGPPLRRAMGGFPRVLSAADALRRRATQPDRKSTRLNSSHVKISYAVFCLKKKT